MLADSFISHMLTHIYIIYMYNAPSEAIMDSPVLKTPFCWSVVHVQNNIDGNNNWNISIQTIIETRYGTVLIL